MVKFFHKIYGGNNMNKKLCCFYVNDIHLITMLLPYINERINESTKIITIFETDMSESAKKVIDGIQGKKSEGLLNLDWQNKKLNYLAESNLADTLVLIQGSKEFMKEANEMIKDRKENCTILNCFEMMQGCEGLQEILDYHDKVVNTSGEKFPEEIFVGYTRNSYGKITV